jgi:DNA-binding GntR family transcriptional regulator
VITDGGLTISPPGSDHMGRDRITHSPEPKLRGLTGQRLVDEVAAALEDAILVGRLSPGERLVETWMSAELGVSRTTVREALLMLERRGLVVSKPRRGTFVTRISQTDADDLCATRALLESYALTIGFDRIDGSVIERLDALVREMKTCDLPDELARLVKLDLEFHGLLVAGANATRVHNFWEGLNGQMSVLFLTTLEQRHTTIDDVVVLHRELMNAIRSGDLACAQQAIILHYLGNRTVVMNQDDSQLASMVEARAGCVDAITNGGQRDDRMGR